MPAFYSNFKNKQYLKAIKESFLMDLLKSKENFSRSFLSDFASCLLPHVHDCFAFHIPTHSLVRGTEVTLLAKIN